MRLPLVMLKCLMLTIIIELILAIIIGIRNKKDILTVILVNVLTNPIVVSIPIIIYSKMGYNARLMSLVLLEAWALLIEGFIYSKTLKFKRINPFILSGILNISSYLIGEIINRL